MKIQQILFVGIGLIGGSIAATIRQKHPDIKLIGMDIDQKSIQLALDQQILDEQTTDFSEAVAASQLVFLCTPVGVTKEYLQQISQLSLRNKLIVTDVSSTKKEITEAATAILPENVTFIGGHPMAGSHKSGFIAADPDLFENAYYIFTKNNEEDTREALLLLQEILAGTRAKFVEMDVEKHDQITGMVSHLPHILATLLVHQNEQFSQVVPESNFLAAGGFRDMTRIAASDPQMWTDIVLSNREILLKMLKDWQVDFAKVEAWLEKQKKAEIFDFFASGKEIREELPVFREGAIPAFHDLFVIVPDKSGVIADVTTILADHMISLINIKIIENREGILGTLQLTFKNEKSVQLAQEVLENQGKYECHTI